VTKLWAFILVAALTGLASAGERHYRLPNADLKQPVIWGAKCETPDGQGLAFGGHEQAAEDGCYHTHLLVDGAWESIVDDLRAANPLQKYPVRVWAIRNRQKAIAACARFLYFQGLPEAEQRERAKALEVVQVKLNDGDLAAVVGELSRLAGLGEYEAGQAKFGLGFLLSAAKKTKPLLGSLEHGVTADDIKATAAAQVDLEKAAEAFDAEPPPRALSPIAYDEKSKLFVLFAGDHLDHLTNDTWVFDPARRKWMQRHPPTAPPPRANHQIKAADGKVTVSGGYTYTSSTDYCGGQYKDIADGDWVYDVAANTWTGGAKPESRDSRVYRTGPFHPDFFLQGPKPDAAATEAKLKALPPNTWILMNPPQKPKLNRDWGTAILDTDLDLILRWSGGHSAHGGSDVPHYYLATNRWELAFPVEFPLGQLYTNTSYPGGYNFNLRPWVTGHTYQNYAYDPTSKMLLFTGHVQHCYVYDPNFADWIARFPKPKGMVYGDCFYTLTCCTTPQGVYCWTGRGGLFRFDAKSNGWQELKVTGKMPTASVDYSTVVYDSKRDRLLMIRADYGKKFDGQVHAVDLKGLSIAPLSPANAATFGFGIDRGCYDPENDLFLLATLLPPDADGHQRTPAYGCAANRWVSLKLSYDVRGDRKDPATPRGHSCGIMYDPRRKLIWGVDTDSNVYVLRLNAKSADVADLR